MYDPLSSEGVRNSFKCDEQRGYTPPVGRPLEAEGAVDGTGRRDLISCAETIRHIGWASPAKAQRRARILRSGRERIGEFSATWPAPRLG